MDSREFDGSIELFLLGELDPAQHREMREYLGDHPEARVQVEAARKMLDALGHHLSEPREPPELSRDVLRHIWKEERRKETQGRSSALKKVFQGKIARIAAALAVILGGLALLHHFSWDGSGTKQVDELAIHVRARLLEIPDGERREDGSILYRTRWKVVEYLQGDPETISLAFHPKALEEKALSIEPEKHSTEKKTARARGDTREERIKRRERSAGAPLDRGEEINSSGEIEVLLLRPDGHSGDFLAEEGVGEERELFIRKVGSELFALDGETLTPEGAGPAPFSGRWSGMAVDKPEDGTSMDSIALELGLSGTGKLEGVASGEFTGGSKNLQNLRIQGKRLLFAVEYRTGDSMEIWLELMGSHLVGEGILADPDGDRCDLFLSRMPWQGKSRKREDSQ